MTNILFTRTMDSQSKVLKTLLQKNNIEFEERNLDTKQWTKEDVAALVPDAMKIPQFIMGNVAVGGLSQTLAHLKASAPAKPAMPGAAKAKLAMPRPSGV